MSLKVFDLQCELGHVFEGWFSSAEKYESQQQKGLLCCPVCDSRKVVRKLSAPRLNMGHGVDQASPEERRPVAGKAAAAVASPAAAQLAQLQAHIMQRFREVIRNTEDVGVRFAEEARRMHEGEASERAIRGVATPDEQKELAEEGIMVMPIPAYLDDDRLQ